MVHALTELLRNVYRALREEGRLLIIQPATADSMLRVVIEGRPDIIEEAQEPTFATYIEATKEAIKTVLEEELFGVEEEAVTPFEENAYHVVTFDSLGAWEDTFLYKCEDLDLAQELVARLHAAVGQKPHEVRKYRKWYSLLLRKQTA